MDVQEIRKPEEHMDNGKGSLEGLLMEEYQRHLMAHSIETAVGKGRPGCQFCPTLKVKTGRPQRSLMCPENFPQRFYRALAKDVNKIHRMARSGHLGATKFMRNLKKMVRERPWDKPPASPGAILTTPIVESA
jgi:hypothetical protein